MSDRIAVSKAAKLLGLKRSEMNERLHAAGIPTFEGEVDFDRVKSIAPTINLCEDDILDRLRYIREGVVPAHSADGPLPAGADLSGDIRKLNAELVVERRTAEHYLQIIVDTADKLGELQTSKNPDERQMGFDMCQWLREKVAEK